MGINDQIWNGQNDPEVIAWRIKHVASSNILADWRHYLFCCKLCGANNKSFKEFVLTHKDVKELGELPNSEEEISTLIMKFSRTLGS